MNREAPIFTDVYTLCAWLVARLGSDPGVLARRILDHSLALLEHITLALRGIDREERLLLADERLIQLRVLLRMAESTGCLQPSQLIYALGLTDSVGRLLGGWRKRAVVAS